MSGSQDRLRLAISVKGDHAREGRQAGRPASQQRRWVSMTLPEFHVFLARGAHAESCDSSHDLNFAGVSEIESK